MQIVFYANNNPLAWLIRRVTRRKGQDWKYVPSHCAIEFSGNIYEFCLSGYNVRKADSRDIWAYPLALSRTDKAELFALSAQGAVYDLDALLFTLVGEHLPHGASLTDAFSRHFDCSRFCAAVMAAGGSVIPDWPGPPSPNDLLRFVLNREPL